MSRQQTNRSEDFGEERGGPSGQRFQQSLIRGGVGAQACCSGLDGSLQDRRGAVVERMGQCKRWVDPLQTVLRERKRAEQRGEHRHRMNGRADIVSKSGKRQRFRARATADRFVRFEDDDR